MSNQPSRNVRGKQKTAAGKESSAARFERIYKTIRERISLLIYPPGSLLNETELAAEFGVSRTPLRSVFQRLYHEGLVVVTNGVGTRVTDIDMKTFKDIYDLRMILAENMGSLSPNKVTAAHIHELEQLTTRAEALYQDKNVETYALVCNDLEELILDLIGSGPLREMTDVLYYRVARIWLTFLPNMNWDEEIKALVSELKELDNALKQNDISGFGHVRKHGLHTILQRISAYMAGG